MIGFLIPKSMAVAGVWDSIFSQARLQQQRRADAAKQLKKRVRRQDSDDAKVLA